MVEIDSSSLRIEFLRHVLARIPEGCFAVLKAFFGYLQKVAAHSKANRMNPVRCWSVVVTANVDVAKLGYCVCANPS